MYSPIPTIIHFFHKPFYDSLQNIIRVIKSRWMRSAGRVVHMAQVRYTYRILSRKPERNRPFGRPMHIWEDNIKVVTNI